MMNTDAKEHVDAVQIHQADRAAAERGQRELKESRIASDKPLAEIKRPEDQLRLMIDKLSICLAVMVFSLAPVSV